MLADVDLAQLAAFTSFPSPMYTFIISYQRMKPRTNQAINPVVTAFSPPARALRRRWLNGLGVGGQGLGEEPKFAAMVAGYQKVQPLMNEGARTRRAACCLPSPARQPQKRRVHAQFLGELRAWAGLYSMLLPAGHRMHMRLGSPGPAVSFARATA